LKNYGTNILSSVDIYYQVNDGTISSMPWSGSLDPGNAIDMTLSQVNVEEGYNTITVYTVNPNGLADSDPTNDPFTEAFGSGTTLLESTIVFDVAPVRFLWVLLDHAGQPLAFGGPYNNVAAYSTVEEDICIPQEGCYDFVIYESGNWGLCCQFGEGSYTLTHVSSGTVLASGAEVGTLGSTKFCLPIQPCGAEGSFDISTLSAQNGNISSTTITLPAESNRPAFTIAGLDQKINGNPSQRWIDLVSVSYTNGSGESIDYQTYTGAEVNSADVSIFDLVQSVTVTLENGYAGSNANVNVTLGPLSFCGEGGCVDSDNDSVCDEDDICPGGDDTIDVDNDGVPDDCDPCVDSDNDSVCDPADICPGGNDLEDADSD
jgi:hypothetical protein